jgi:hypothetical protein
MDKVQVRLSNLMALDALAFGSRGCSPSLYADALALVVSGRVTLRPFIEQRPMREGPQLFGRLTDPHEGGGRRTILIPDYEGGSVALKDHRLVADPQFTKIRYERRPARDLDGSVVPDLYDAWIWLNNLSQMNSYTTATLTDLILAFREASTDRAVVSVVLTAVGEKAFLLRRQHEGVRRVLRWQSRRIQAVHAAVQRHGDWHPHVRQTGNQPRQRPACGRRPGDRHGMRLFGRIGFRTLRPGGTAPRLCARRRLNRFSASLRRLRPGRTAGLPGAPSSTRAPTSSSPQNRRTCGR